MTPHEDKDAYVIDLTLRALPQVDPFVVRWQAVHFGRDDSADPSKLRDPKTAGKTSKATYRRGSSAEIYGPSLLEMPPMSNEKDPSLSEVITYICERVAQMEGECSLKEGQRIFYCLANMKKNSPIIFDRATRLWRGRNYVR